MDLVEREKKLGLNGFHLKMIALIAMVFDHMRLYLGSMNLPVWFNWLGRIAAPIFIFLTVEGYVHTRNRRKYMGRLYIGYILMNLGNNIIVELVPRDPMIPIINSMFGSLFLVLLYLYLFDGIKDGIKNRRVGKVFLGIIGMILPIAINIAFLLLMGNENIPLIVLNGIMTLLPLPFLVEGGLVFILLALIFYILREKKKLGLILYMLLSLVIGINGDLTVENLLQGSYQWMMIFAGPLIYLYNGEEGRKMKSFFYFFYPIHVYLLYIVGSILLNK